MKICLLSEYFYPDNTGGTGTVLANLLRSLKDHYPDLEIDVITSRSLYRGGDGRLPLKENWAGIRILRVRTPKANPFSTAKRLATNTRFSVAAFRKLMARLKKYDLILVSTAPPPLPLAAKAYTRLTGTPYVYLIYDLYPDIAIALKVLEKSKAVRIIQNLQKKWMHSSAKTVVLGRCMADYLVENYEMPREQIAAIPIGSDPTKIVPADKNSRFRVKHGLEGFVVLWAGNFGQHQNFDAILDAAKMVQNDAHKISFVFVGDGAQKGYLADRIADEQITNACMFPFVPEEEFSDMLASADVSLVSLEPGAEGLGVPSKFYNILASARPTVALVTPDCEVARVIDEEECGVRVEQGDAGQLATTLLHLANSPDLLARMGQNARRACEQQYSIEQVTRKFYEVFLSARRGAMKTDSLPQELSPIVDN